MKIEEFELLNARDELLKGRFFLPSNSKGDLPVVIMLTGDGPKGSGSISWQKIPPLLAHHGICSCLFDFSGLGASEGSRSSLTLTKGIEDFRRIFEFIKETAKFNTEKLGIMGSSFGACVALMCPDIVNQCSALGLKSPCAFLPEAYYKELSSNEFGNWRDNKFSEINGYNFEVFLDPFKYNAYENAAKIHTKCLITHGNADEVVPISQSVFLNTIMAPKPKFIEFDSCDHGYSGNNWKKMIKTFVAFYRQELVDNA